MPLCDYSQPVGILDSDPRLRGGNNFSCDFCRNWCFFFILTSLSSQLTSVLSLFKLSVVDHCRMYEHISVHVCRQNLSPGSAKEDNVVMSVFLKKSVAISIYVTRVFP